MRGDAYYAKGDKTAALKEFQSAMRALLLPRNLNETTPATAARIGLIVEAYIGLLAERLVDATNWIKRQSETTNLGIGYFGSSTGGGAALVAAAELGEEIGAVVSRGGRPDLAGAALPQVTASTLLIVGGFDYAVIEMNGGSLGSADVAVGDRLMLRA